MSKRGFGKGRSPTKFSFTYEDVARITNSSVAVTRKRAQRGQFNPNSLVSVLEFINNYLRKDEYLAEDLINDSEKLIKKIEK